MEHEFLNGFARVTGLSKAEADEQWAAFSRMLSDQERDRIEAGGRESGEREGREFLKLYPLEEESAEAR